MIKNVEDFKKHNEPKGKRSLQKRLKKFEDEILDLYENSYSYLQIQEYLFEVKNFKVSTGSLNHFLNGILAEKGSAKKEVEAKKPDKSLGIFASKNETKKDEKVTVFNPDNGSLFPPKK
jgi:hypothetical protein